jgi:hypothetical protein
MRKHLYKVRKEKMEQTGIRLSVENRNRNIVLKIVNRMFNEQKRTNNEEGD